MKKKGLVLSIEKTSVHDGPGLRTSIFLKGCPLHCLWCHNPESQAFTPELYYFDEKCIRCGACMYSCRKGCHVVAKEEHIIDRSKCTACNACVAACPYSALEVKGEYMDANTVLAEAEKDRPYYEASGGGITVSGGEPLSQFDYTCELLAEAKTRGFHTCLETCGYAPAEKLLKIREYVDLFLYDFKESNKENHKRYTGVDNDLIINNLKEIDKLGSKSILRCPIIPGLNDRAEHLQEIAGLAGQLKNIKEINIMPYHSYGKSKSRNIGKEYPLEAVMTAKKQQADQWVAFVQANTKVPVKKG